MQHGADATAIDKRFVWRPGMMHCVSVAQMYLLPEDAQRMWVLFNVKIRFRLGRHLQRVRDRLDRPPSSQLGTAHPTRDELIAHLRTAGRRFARDYWTDGIPLFFPGLQASLGPLPDEFEWRRALVA